MRSSRAAGAAKRAAGWCKAAGAGSELASELRAGNAAREGNRSPLGLITSRRRIARKRSE